LHNGSNGIVHGSWQPLPGEPAAKIWPYLRKVDIISSNAYIIRSGSLTLVIDPGSLLSQAGEIVAALSLPGEIAPPRILVILTHTHVDHFRSLVDHPYLRNRDNVILAVQEAGAHALETADARLTQAALFEQDLLPIRPALVLFSRSDIERGGEVAVACGHGQEIRLATNIRTAKDGRFFIAQVLRTGDSCPVVMYPAPGHSPDSICIRIGSLLFIGDLLFAAGMGVAGISGWNRDDLIRSIDTVIALLQEGTITHCCPGHGRILSCDEAVRVLSGVKKDAAGLEGIAEITCSRATETALYAEGLMDEVEGLFTLISARLLFVSHVLEELEESGEADMVGKLIDTARLDDLLGDFQRFSAEYRAGGVADIQLALKAGQIVQKLDRMFAQQELSLVLDPEYVRRAGRLLCDYTTVLRGFRQPRMIRKLAPAPLIADLIGTLNQSGVNENLIGSADDPGAFTRALVRKIARSPVFERVTCTLAPESDACSAEVDIIILGDVIREILEDLAGAGCVEIAVRVFCENHLLSITIEPQSHGITVPGDLRMRFLENECLRSGGSLIWVTDTEPACVRIDLPEAEGP